MLNSLAYNLQTCFLNLFFLNRGIMFASFHSKGTIPSCSDMLNTCASGILICSTISFSILGDIPSTPGDWSVGCSCETVHDSCHTFQRYRHIRVTIYSAPRPIPPNPGIEGSLAAVWHWRKTAHASIETTSFSTWSSSRKNRDQCTH